MSKLRLIKERTEAKDVDTDLRGLGENEIIHASAPYACLAVRGLEGAGSETYLQGLQAAYDLKAQPGEEQGTLHLHARVLGAGEHKLQAVTLFVAALDILKHHPGASVLLYEVSRLHDALQNSIRHAGHPRQDGLRERVHSWKADGHALTADGHVILHLRQAGFDVPHAEHALKLTRAELETHFRELAGSVHSQVHSRQETRKAA